MTDRIWYACYGSNLCYDRFMTYIAGGTISSKGHDVKEVGCIDKSKPVRDMPIDIPYRLVFIDNSPRWTGGYCFLDPVYDESAHTKGRAYDISVEQFHDVLVQENNGLSVPDIDLSSLEEWNSIEIRPEARYGKLLVVGEFDGIPAVTFTYTDGWAKENDLSPKMPAEAYLDVIRRGLGEIGMESSEIDKYLADRIPGYAKSTTSSLYFRQAHNNKEGTPC